MGTADLVSGLIAQVSKLLAERNESPYIPERDLCNILHDLQRQGKFRDELQHLDFHRVGPNSFSRVLEGILFQAGAWGALKMPNPAVGTIWVTTEMADAQLASLRADYKDTPEVFDRLESLAQAFVKALSRPA